MLIRWFTRLKAFRPVIEAVHSMGIHVSAGERYQLTMEDNDMIYFIGNCDKEVCLKKEEEGIYYILVKEGLGDVYP